MSRMSRSEVGRLGGLASAAYQARKKKERVAIYLENPRACKQCGRSLPYEKRRNVFCSHSCAARFNNQNRPLRIKEDFCLICSKSLYRGLKYCSCVCAAKARIAEVFAEIDRTQFVSDNRRPTAKKYLIDKHGHRCEICGLAEWHGHPISLILDHIDGNSDNGNLSNLRIVCPNCDAQLPTYKSKNKGNGRAYRRKAEKEQRQERA